MVTLNMQQATRVSDYTSFFLNGEIIETGLTDDIFVNPQEKKNWRLYYRKIRLINNLKGDILSSKKFPSLVFKERIKSIKQEFEKLYDNTVEITQKSFSLIEVYDENIAEEIQEKNKE